MGFGLGLAGKGLRPWGFWVLTMGLRPEDLRNGRGRPGWTETNAGASTAPGDCKRAL